MINPLLNSDLANQHRMDLLREAQARRLAREARASLPGRPESALSAIRSYLSSLYRRASSRKVAPVSAVAPSDR